MPDPANPGGNYDYRPSPLPAQHPQHPQHPPQHPLRQGTMPNINPGFMSPDVAAHLQPYGPQSAIQPQRPGSTAPYPIRPGSAGPGSHQPHRPSSAAGFGPLPRLAFGMSRTNRFNSIVMGGSPPGMIPPAGTYPTGPTRPFTSMSQRRSSGAGRPPYGPPQHPPNLNGPDGAGYPGGYNGEAVPRIHTPKPPQQGGSFPLDIGFEAPDPRPKPSKTAPPSGPIAAPPGGSGRPGTAQGRPGTAQGPQGPIIKKPLPGTQRGGGQGSPELFSPTNGPSSPPRAAVQVARPVSAEAPPKPASTPLPKPPGKGPKTFEEMGVPPGPKNEQDCVSVFITPQRILLTILRV